jgi:ligand-binding sensor domain-containing protein
MPVMCLLLPFQALAQTETIRFKRFSDEEGLPNNLFKEVMQDKMGIFWMAGLDGLARYDGYVVREYRHSHMDSASLSGNNITSIYEDTKGRLWIGLMGLGLNVSNGTKTSFQSVHFPMSSKELSSATIRDITQDSQGRMWIASEIGLYIIREDSGRFHAELYKDSMASEADMIAFEKSEVLYTDDDGKIWIGTSTGLCMIDPKYHWTFYPKDFQGLPARSIHDIQLDRENQLWVSCRGDGPRLYFVSTINAMNFTTFDKIPFRSAGGDLHFTFDLDNRLWALVFGDQAYGFDFRDSSVFLQSAINSEIRHERFFRKPFVDNSGDTWLPCEGFYIYPFPKGFKTYTHPYAFHQSNTCIYGTGDFLWMAYREKGLVRIDQSSGSTTIFSSVEEADKPIPVDHVQDILKVRSGNMILVGFGNVAVMGPGNNIFASYTVGGTNRAAFEDSAGRIWIGGYSGLHLFSETQGVIKTYTVPSENANQGQFIQTIVEDRKGNIWFASDLHGLTMLNPVSGVIRQFMPVKGDSHSLPSISVLDIAVDQNNLLWLATDVALVRFDPENFSMTLYDRSDGLANDYISAILCVPGGLVWASTHEGISSFDPSSEQFVNYSKGDGLANFSYYTRSKFLAENGLIYFGGKNGVDFFNPASLRINPTAPRMVLTGLAINTNQRMVDPSITEGGGTLSLSYKDDLLEIQIAGIHDADQVEVKYRYKLEGLHDDWIDLGGQRAITFSGLPPGDYVFKAEAISGDGVWCEDELTIPIHVAPPFYATAWFSLISILLLLALLYAVIRYRERTIKKKDKLEAEVNRKIVELERRALQAQMNPHFIYNSMNSIQQFMIMHDMEGAMKYLTKFSRILRTVLTISAQNRIPLADEIILIRDYLELENMRFPDKFTYDIHVSPDINIHTVEIPPFFIQPQVENAIRHGLLKKTTPGHLQIEIRVKGAHLHIVVEDNGIGRDAAREAKFRDAVVNESKGLAIVEERLSHLHSTNGFKPFNIVDLYDTSNQPSGTRVEIVLPID